MAKYIDAEKIKRHGRRGGLVMWKEIEDMSAADVVEVVRCGECAVTHNHWTGCPRMNGTIMRPDDYCSYGERKVTE